MRIAFIVWEFPILSETFILNQIVGLLERGHEIDIYAEQVGDASKVHHTVEQYNLLERTYYLPQMPENIFIRLLKGILLLMTNGYKDPKRFGRSLNIFKYGKLAAFLWLLYTVMPYFKKSYDIIHCQFGTQSYRGMAFRWVNAPDAKLITTFRGHDISSFIRVKGERSYELLFKNGDFFLANCEFFRQRVIALGCDANKIVVHRSGLDCSCFPFSLRDLPANGTIRIATIGRLVEKKGIEYSIRAIAKQAKITPNIEYNILGDGCLREKLQKLIYHLNIGNIVQLLGWKTEKEIIEILNESHIFIAPSITAEDGNQDAPINVLKEAMAMGLPVISTYHGGIPELVEDGVSGFLVPERNVDALAEKLGYLIEHPKIWSTMGEAGRAYVEVNYNLNELNNRLVEIYEQLLVKSPLNTLSNKMF
jgi:colanic acid/amylovoran biosynthesis glycosyltransferase